MTGGTHLSYVFIALFTAPSSGRSWRGGNRRRPPSSIPAFKAIKDAPLCPFLNPSLHPSLSPQKPPERAPRLPPKPHRSTTGPAAIDHVFWRVHDAPYPALTPVHFLASLRTILTLWFLLWCPRATQPSSTWSSARSKDSDELFPSRLRIPDNPDRTIKSTTTFCSSW